MKKQSKTNVSRRKLPSKYRGLKPRGVKSFQQPKPTLFRRILRLFFNPITISISLLFSLLFALILTYFWFEFSDRIDVLLRGEVYTSTAGIYSAPKTLKAGETFSKDDLESYLTLAGYIKKNQQADESRSRYEIRKNEIEIEPGKTAIIDGEQKFPSITVKFNKDGKAVDSIKDNKSEQELKEVQLEPKILSSIAAEGDGKRKVVEFNDLPKNLIKAITVTEDRAFFEHYGVNFRGIGRALWRRYDKSEDDSPLANQGGSSITQQLVKNLLLNRDQTLERKAKEAYMSVILETRLTKEQIFTLYVNQIYLGQDTGVSIY
jgi:penicillin-binding protein 1B